MTVLHLRGVFLPDEVARDAWIVDGRLTFERYGGAAETITVGGWITPGLVDAHCHVGLAPDRFVADPDGQAAQALADRDAGALLLRDAGSPVDNTSVQARDDLPRLIRAGRHIARPRRYMRHLGIEVEPDALLAEVETQAARGDGWVKLVGDWIDRSVGDLAPLWPDGVLNEAVSRAHELGSRVAVHVFGVDAQAGMAVVPTLMNTDNFRHFAAQGEEKFPVYAAHMRALHATSRERVRRTWAAGVPVYVGTDAGGALRHGLVREEIRALVAAGIPQDEVIAQASWQAREWLGLPGLVEGAHADLVSYD